jgi:hypothetical protein
MSGECAAKGTDCPLSAMDSPIRSFVNDFENCATGQSRYSYMYIFLIPKRGFSEACHKVKLSALFPNFPIDTQN